MMLDHEFDPADPEEERRKAEDEEFKRRVRREVRRMNSGAADEDIRTDEAEEAAEEAARTERAERERRRRSSTLWGMISGTILLRDGISRYYPYMLVIAGLFLLNIIVMFRSLYLDRRYMRLERDVEILHERALRLEEQRFRLTTHSAIVEELARRGIPLRDPATPGEQIE